MASIYKRGKTWTYKVYYYENGKQKAVSKSGFFLKHWLSTLRPYIMNVIDGQVRVSIIPKGSQFNWGPFAHLERNFNKKTTKFNWFLWPKVVYYLQYD